MLWYNLTILISMKTDGKGKMIGEVSAADYDSYTGCFVKNGKYYDMDLKLVFDESTIEYTLYDSSEYYSIYYKETDYGVVERSYYIRNGINVTSLDMPSSASNIWTDDTYFRYNYYDANMGTSYTVYCNYQGKTIFKYDANASISVNAVGKVLIFKVVDNSLGGTSYYIAK